MTKWKLRIVALVDVTRNVGIGVVAGRIRQILLVCRTPRIERVVVERFLPHAAGPAHDQLSGGIGLAIKRAHESGPRLDAGEPRRQHRRNMLKRPGQRQRTPAEQDENHRLSRGDDFFQQFLLTPGQSEKSARRGLARHFSAGLAQRQDHDVRLPGSSHGGSQIFIGPARDADALEVNQVLLSHALGERSVERNHILVATQSGPGPERARQIVGKRPDQGDALSAARERKYRRVVRPGRILQQHERPLGRRSRQRDAVRTHHGFGLTRFVGVRTLEEAECELQSQDVPHRLVDAFLWNLTGAHQLRQVIVIDTAGHVHVDARHESPCAPP